MLGNEYYTLNNTLNYQMFLGHCEQVGNKKNSFGCKMYHVMMSALEGPPIIGQIVALFELALMKIFPKKANTSTDDKKITLPVKPLPVHPNPQVKNTGASVNSVISKIWPGNWTSNQKIIVLGVTITIASLLAYNYFSKLPIETEKADFFNKFCMSSMHGNDDVDLISGETLDFIRKNFKDKADFLTSCMESCEKSLESLTKCRTNAYAAF